MKKSRLFKQIVVVYIVCTFLVYTKQKVFFIVW